MTFICDVRLHAGGMGLGTSDRAKLPLTLLLQHDISTSRKHVLQRQLRSRCECTPTTGRLGSNVLHPLLQSREHAVRGKVCCGFGHEMPWLLVTAAMG